VALCQLLDTLINNLEKIKNIDKIKIIDKSKNDISTEGLLIQQSGLLMIIIIYEKTKLFRCHLYWDFFVVHINLTLSLHNTMRLKRPWPGLFIESYSRRVESDN
jgi:hypothetical protein